MAAGGGAIVSVLSIAALAGLRGVGNLAARSKAAALSLSEDLRGQLADKGVQVTAVIAGPILTDMARAPAGRHPAAAVARAILDGVAGGCPLVFPIRCRRAWAPATAADPWSLERRFQRGSGGFIANTRF